MIKGLNHITLAVRDLEESFRFYTDVLQCRLIARWDRGAYLIAGDVWVALMLDPRTRPESLPEYTHIAFSLDVDDFSVVSQRIRDSGAQIWKENESEGASLYFEDPNGHKLEIHVGDLNSRLVDARQNPWPCLEILDSDV
jgi:catechol 2,3-dioxygenase-like lactoylglutathione lyase family enzyme